MIIFPSIYILTDGKNTCYDTIKEYSLGYLPLQLINNITCIIFKLSVGNSVQVLHNKCYIRELIF